MENFSATNREVKPGWIALAATSMIYAATCYGALIYLMVKNDVRSEIIRTVITGANIPIIIALLITAHQYFLDRNIKPLTLFDKCSYLIGGTFLTTVYALNLIAGLGVIGALTENWLLQGAALLTLLIVPVIISKSLTTKFFFASCPLRNICPYH